MNLNEPPTPSHLQSLGDETLMALYSLRSPLHSIKGYVELLKLYPQQQLELLEQLSIPLDHLLDVAMAAYAEQQRRDTTHATKP